MLKSNKVIGDKSPVEAEDVSSPPTALIMSTEGSFSETCFDFFADSNAEWYKHADQSSNVNNESINQNICQEGVLSDKTTSSTSHRIVQTPLLEELHVRKNRSFIKSFGEYRRDKSHSSEDNSCSSCTSALNDGLIRTDSTLASQSASMKTSQQFMIEANYDPELMVVDQSTTILDIDTEESSNKTDNLTDGLAVATLEVNSDEETFNLLLKLYETKTKSLHSCR
jgi:hypothetical protein